LRLGTAELRREIHFVAGQRHTPCSMQHRACNIQHTTYGIQHHADTSLSPYNIQLATCRAVGRLARPRRGRSGRR
jgi:hypothetical protein